MKHMNRILALALALMMVLGLATTAYATTGSVKNDTARTYAAYQIFSGTQAPDSAVLGDIAWGTGIKSDDFLSALKDLVVDGAKPFASCNDAVAVANVLKDKADKSVIAQAFANLAAKHLTGNSTAVAVNTTATLDSGYYLLVDTSTANASQNPALLQVTGDTALNITEKTDAPEINKTIENEGEAAEGSIGDEFTFVLTATMPSTFEGYDTYKIIFHDTMSRGLDYVENSITVPEGFTANIVKNQDGTTTITVTDDNVLDNGIAASATLTVSYKATLNSDAVIGSVGNPNTVVLEYSNNPNVDTDTKRTPEDTVVVFTFELDVTKVDGQNAETKLEGAEFKLQNAAGKWLTVDTNGKVTGWVDSVDTASVLKSGEDGLFKIIGLDQGTYKLKETKAPAGYNLLQNEITIVITATVTETEDAQELTALTIKVGEGNPENGNVATGIVATTVENNAGATLPETGGIGTTLFYAIGGLLVVAAVVLLVTKKRMNAAE